MGNFTCPVCKKKCKNLKMHTQIMHPTSGGTPKTGKEKPAKDVSMELPESQDFELTKPDKKTATAQYHCVDCGAPLTKGQTPCPGCGNPLEWGTL